MIVSKYLAPPKNLPRRFVVWPNHLSLASMAFRHSFGAVRIAIATTIRTTLGAQISRSAASNKLDLITTIQPADPAITPIITETT